MGVGAAAEGMPACLLQVFQVRLPSVIGSMGAGELVTVQDALFRSNITAASLLSLIDGALASQVDDLRCVVILRLLPCMFINSFAAAGCS